MQLIQNHVGRFERYNIARNDAGFYTSVGITARYQFPSRLLENGIKNLIFHALHNLICRHPALGITVGGTPQSPSWVRLASIDLEKVVQFEDALSDNTTPLIEAAHQIPFEKSSPLWRVLVVKLPIDMSFDVAVFLHHAIADGTSGLAFHSTLKEALSETSNTLNSMVEVPRLDLLPALEDIHPLPLSLSFVLSQVVQTFLPSSDKQCWTGPPFRSENNITHLRTVIFPFARVESLLRLCRSNNTTITALITVTIANILAQIYPQYSRFTSVGAMSFRRFTGTDKSQIVNYVSSFSHKFSRVSQAGYIPCSSFSWNAVQSCHEDIKAATASAKNQKVGLLRYVNDYANYFRKRVGKKRDYSFEVSNVGVLSQNSESVIKRVIFSQSSSVPGAAYVFSVATAEGGDMAIALTWQDGIIETETAETILSQLETDLNSFTP